MLVIYSSECFIETEPPNIQNINYSPVLKHRFLVYLIFDISFHLLNPNKYSNIIRAAIITLIYNIEIIHVFIEVYAN